MSDSLVIAIDGPVASGKTAVGKALADRLGYRMIDTGLMYRAITVLALQKGISLDDESSLEELADQNQVKMETKGIFSVSIGTNNVTAYLHTPEVEKAVSFISRVVGVRRSMVDQQREMAKEGGVVMVGRDIGTHVLTSASLKVFLTASQVERARRRHLELLESGAEILLEEVVSTLELRDKLDSQRLEGPLRRAEDAYLLDTGGMEMGQVVDHLLEIIFDG